ncbi:MAG TPA: aminotransferase class III-fold pyridoxal phosphate-dependent enzyme [Actinomycetota bacterium]|nr:aminotransferase class III-fold pyridoxal phosphate-dependent enzyme [Actinomycetota bacterium]
MSAELDTVRADDTALFPRILDLEYPIVDRGEGVWLRTTGGRDILDACSGGAMVTSLGYGAPEVVAAAADQAERISYMYAHHFSNEPQERLARRMIEVVAPGMARVRFVSGGSEANETALRLARAYHAERGQPERWRVISPSQAYHGSTMATLALTGRRSLQEPHTPYLADHAHIAPVTWRSDPTGRTALEQLDRVLEVAGPEVAAFFCEPVSAAAFPAYSPPDLFWEGLAERRDRHGFLICFDEIVTGMGRVGTWLAADQLPIEPDIVTLGKGLGAGYAPLGAVVCRQEVWQALAEGSREFDLGHTWDGAPLPCAVGLAVLDQLEGRGLVDRVRERGPSLRDRLEEALRDVAMVREVRGRGFLIGVELVDPRNPVALLPDDLDAGDLVERTALDHGLLVLSAHPTPDGYTGDQVVLAPAFTATDHELEEMVRRFATAMADVEGKVIGMLSGGGR